jgi:hypothetical protein
VTVSLVATAVALALLAAGCFCTTGYLQHESARAAPRRGPLHPRLLLDLLADRRLALSLALSVAAFAFQLAALHLAPLALIQPLLATQPLCYLTLAMAAGVLIAAHQAQLMADWPAAHAVKTAASKPPSIRAA